jgi:hypothetical protein
MKTTVKYLFTGAVAGVCFALYTTLYAFGAVLRLVEITYRTIPR